MNCRKEEECSNPHGRDPRDGDGEERHQGSQQPPQVPGTPRETNRVLEDDTLPPASVQPVAPLRQPPQSPTPLQSQAPQPPPLVTAQDGSRAEARHTIWKDLTRDELTTWLDNTYHEVAGWPTGKLFEPPRCAATTNIAKEMTGLVTNYVNDTPLAPFALKILFIMPKLLLQKTFAKSKACDNVKAATRRMDLWLQNKLGELLEEAKLIQRRRRRPTEHNERQKDKAHCFAERMRHGNVSSSLRALSDRDAGGVLPLNRQTLNLLREKHPPPGKVIEDGLRLEGCHAPSSPVIYEMITGNLVWQKSLQTNGSAGPSGLCARGWRRLLSSAWCGTAGSDLCNAVATLTRKLATTDCQNLGAFTACRLIPLDKGPGCRPVGIGEVLRRIVGKCIMAAVKEDVKEAAGNLQVCAGHQAGGEAAIHAMREVYSHGECEAALLVDATNAFNSINRKLMLHHIKIKCPPLSKYVENTYGEPCDMHIHSANKTSGTVIKSLEGTTQGDPVAMAMYALGMSALQVLIEHGKTNVKQVAYADDLAGAGKLVHLKEWWDLVMVKGPEIGYLPNPTKSVLIVKPEHYDQALVTFANSGITVTKDGQRHLGAVIGTEEHKKEYVGEKVSEWVREIEVLTEMARTEPHAAYSAYTHGLQHRWRYVMRTIPDTGPLFRPLELAIRNTLLPVLLKSPMMGDNERALLELPVSLGGLGITSPESLADTEYHNSVNLTRSLTDRIIAQDVHGDVDHAAIAEQKRIISKTRLEQQKNCLVHLKTVLPAATVRKIDIAQETGASNWLTSLPIRANGFSLNKQEFIDAIALRYGWPVEDLPNTCVCGNPNSIDHTMTCKKGGFVSIRHDEVRDLTASMLKEVCHDVATEPRLLPLEGELMRYRTANTTNEARVDVSARGFWTRGQRAFFDIRVFDPTAACHSNLSLDAAHLKNEQEKMRAYSERILHVEQGSFSPLVFTTSGGMGPKAKKFYARLADLMVAKKHQPRSHVVAWMRCRLSFSLLRSALLCLRGTRCNAPLTTDINDIRDLDYEATVVESGLRVDRRGVE